MSVNHYELTPGGEQMLRGLGASMDWVDPGHALNEYYQITDRPLLISEFNIRANDAGLPNEQPSNILFLTMNTQQERADQVERIVRDAIDSGYIVGYHWFQYMDEPAEGRFDGENGNTGLVDIHDNPWTVLTDRLTRLNADAAARPTKP